jgi:hypothetical protein
MKHQLIVRQVYRVVREIAVEVEAKDWTEAVDKQNDADAPAYDDPRWVETKTLENEEVEA